MIEDDYLKAVILAESNLVEKVLKKALGMQPTEEDLEEVEKRNINQDASGAYSFDFYFLGLFLGKVKAIYDENELISGFQFTSTTTTNDD